MLLIIVLLLKRVIAGVLVSELRKTDSLLYFKGQFLYEIE